jgi:hypothetical protein
LRDVQLLQAQHAKEKFEMEMVSFEEIESKKINNHNIQASTKLKHLTELHAEKEVVIAKKETAKEELLVKDQSKELRRLVQEQRNAMKDLMLRTDRK